MQSYALLAFGGGSRSIDVWLNSQPAWVQILVVGVTVICGIVSVYQKKKD